ncbi:bifunctional tRNA (5-methylaminomethyl-2-thiouridine)(34)-methyltransferase MnmD/FAD-dependent 5-carboxymethylaminomethyl-2-thiouridine(34) oxidoreductase MnmC [Reinekea blandensis]|nr:bifunctional tRNA (5-methylaminomethyl-2-thiouridine)(34)-methyltransferase MnmD/FAD-dependent 5-carboxymethylaminomethyl-2-thiouridine(34) oxidoreductase MnmC [Reinekea blandensis]
MKTADLIFDEDGTPLSNQFDDVYFSKGHGPDETRYVFVDQNNLAERWSQLEAGTHFCIAETGFGTGLNFLVAWRTFLEHAPSDARLTFISCEKYPLLPADLAQSHEQWPQFADLSEPLRQQYPPAVAGYHSLSFDRVRLLLMQDDAASAYTGLSARVDAWFLDGFAPSKNPDMWQPDLFRQMARLSHRGTSFATFTAARLVRDGLQGAGFSFKKVPGFGRKRHMLSGAFNGLCGPLLPNAFPSAALANPVPNQKRRIAIIGAGIAGVTTAIELQKRDYQVTLFDRQPAAALGGSGNEQGAVYAKLSAQPTAANRFYAQALILAQRQLADLPDTVPHDACGLVQLAQSDKDQARQAALDAEGFIPPELAHVASAETLRTLTGITQPHSGLWFPDGGWVSPRALVRYLIDTHQIRCQFNTTVTRLQYDQSGWTLTSAEGDAFQADQVVLSSAFETTAFEQTGHLPLNPIAGQITRLTATEQHRALKAVICTDRYVMPVRDDVLTIGSTFRVKSTDDQLYAQDHEENLTNLSIRVPNLVGRDDTIIGGRAAVRCNSPDYLPLVGAISDETELRDTYQVPLQKNRTRHLPPIGHLPGLWVNVAHGSKGLCTAPLCAQLLASMISGEPYPMPADLVDALNPNRFLVRQLIREQRKKT